MLSGLYVDFFFFFNDPASTEIYTLSLHDALPISRARGARALRALRSGHSRAPIERLRESRRACAAGDIDRKSTRLNSSHQIISYAVFCLKKKKNKEDKTFMLSLFE